MSTTDEPHTIIHHLKDFLNREERFSHSIATHFRHQSFIAIIRLFTEMGSSIAIGLFFLGWMAFAGFREILPLAVVYCLQVGTVEIIKTLFKRPRPKTNTQHPAIFKVTTTSGSFPSGHTSNVFCIALIISYYYGLAYPQILIPFIIAASIGMSRIYLGKHYILDVLGGLLFGSLSTYLFLMVYTVSFR